MNLRPIFTLMLAVFAGCGPSTPTADTARPLDDSTAPKALDLPPVAGPKPDKSEPAAATLVNAVLMAHTSSQPSMVDKLKKVHVKRKGVVRFAEVQSNATMEIFIWGDQYRATYSAEAKGNAADTFSLNGNTGWKLLPVLGPQPSQMTPDDLDTVLPDVRGDRLLFLFPLADEKLTAVTARESKAGSDAVVRVWVGDAPPVLLSVDGKTNRLKRITYEGKESGQVATRSLELFDLAPVAGVLLPNRVQYAIGTVSLTNWTKIEYEVPGVFELSVFDKP
ncbi:hypothetical protein [Limnoglobus roseus]|uniref:DUF4292 domain-containing protein n=1 Tax=Limnoglobus roseus TaxID=2598579 RepID=A0A5C1AM70_9BACT|nr:hypothetical protein [Limnoglobus roseus]QEL20321.1 hypothetical protein PX52LOC_07414 [Limnoglobus roseus]